MGSALKVSEADFQDEDWGQIGQIWRYRAAGLAVVWVERQMVGSQRPQGQVSGPVAGYGRSQRPIWLDRPATVGKGPIGENEPGKRKEKLRSRHPMHRGSPQLEREKAGGPDIVGELRSR